MPQFLRRQPIRRTRVRHSYTPDELKKRAEARRVSWAEGESQQLANTNPTSKLQILGKILGADLKDNEGGTEERRRLRKTMLGLAATKV